MKALKVIIGILVAIVAILVVIGFVAPKEAIVERSISIAAPSDLIWNNIKSLEAQHEWSPWAKRDPNMTYGFEGDEGTIGSKYSWSGNEDVGTGYQQIESITEGSRIEQDLVFTAPWESEADVWIDILDDGEEQKVNWGFKTEFDFFSSIYMMMADMDAQLGPDFEEGLAYLKEICEKQASESPALPEEEFEVDGVKITEKQFGPKTYIAFKEKVAMADLQGFFAKHYPAIMQLVLGAGYEMDGMPSAIYFSWDEENQQTEVAAGIPIKGFDIELDGYETITVPPGMVCQVAHYGPYDSLGTVHMAIEKHMKARSLTGSIAIEEYVTDPTTVEDANKILTLITYPIGNVE